jgi:hypothetical protein
MAHSQAVADTSVNPSVALADLAGLVGAWDMEIWNASFLSSPKERVHAGPAQFEWIEDGSLLALRQGEDPDGPPVARWIIGRDEPSERYSVFYSDSRRVFRIYSMSFDGREWKLWRDNREFARRFLATLSDDSRTLTGCWEKSSNGGVWEHDSNVEYIRKADADGLQANGHAAFSRGRFESLLLRAVRLFA